MRGADALQLPVARRRVVVGVLDLFRAADGARLFRAIMTSRVAEFDPTTIRQHPQVNARSRDVAITSPARN